MEAYHAERESLCFINSLGQRIESLLNIHFSLCHCAFLFSSPIETKTCHARRQPPAVYARDSSRTLGLFSYHR